MIDQVRLPAVGRLETLGGPESLVQSEIPFRLGDTRYRPDSPRAKIRAPEIVLNLEMLEEYAWTGGLGHHISYVTSEAQSY